MKKFICITAILLQTAFLLLNSSCEDENHMKDMVASDYGYSLRFSNKDISFKSLNPQTLSVDINSYDFYDTPWRLEDIPSWITVSQTSGKGPKTITIKASENKSKSPRNGTITLSSTVPYWSYSVKLNVSQEAMPEYACVDLGLSVKWATFNVGASEPEDYGEYFAWGATEPWYQPGYAQSESPVWKSGKSAGYTWVNTPYQTANTTLYSSTKWTKYLGSTTSSYKDASATDADALKTVLDQADDAAHANWGGNWRMPTKAELDELFNTSNCTWTWATLNGVEGYKVESKKSGFEGNWIFLPATGFRLDSSLGNVGYAGHYWSSSLDEDDSYYACSLFFASGGYFNLYDGRLRGHSVRPVCQVPATSLSLNRQSVEIIEGDTVTLTATVQFENGATANTATWTSSNTGVATVDQTGKVTAVSVGTCTITATSGSCSATCSVTVKSSPYKYVDLGLSVKWATCNVGATKPEEYGDYFAWGETSPKSDYSLSTYKYCKGSYDSMTKYCDDSSYGYNGYTDNKTVLDLADDAAHVNWGGEWRLPTRAEQDELRNTSNCTWTRTTMNGVNGYKVVSKKSGYAGNWIFLPAAGYRGGTSLDYVGPLGYYWSSSLYTDYPYGAYSLIFDSGGAYRYNYYRDYGLSVRPVCP